ncbi:116 kDa U5 small nuclear ribonucleoprotein component [Cryptosporidium felis]|nr:116 kDa U5 small nuclear ribonucleoprotein component [Cryptosporidium felis]
MDLNDIYDEFGNYIQSSDRSELSLSESNSEVSSGPGELEGQEGSGTEQKCGVAEDNDDSGSDIFPGEDQPKPHGKVSLVDRRSKVEDQEMRMETEPERGEGAIVLHEEKEYYPDASQVYGEDVEILVEEEDHQHIDEPLIAPAKENSFDLTERHLEELETSFSFEFLRDMMDNSEFLRNVSLVGDLHFGKTTFLDMLVKSTHSYRKSRKKLQIPERYLDCRRDEQDRGISIKASPISLVLPNSQGKSFLFNFMDTPGHVNFADEVCVSVRISDGVILLVDCVVGVSKHLERLLLYSLSQGKKIVLVLSQIDRLVLECRLPPYDAYFKLKSIISALNDSVMEFTKIHGLDQGKNLEELLFSPERGNVGFSSGKFGFFFTLNSFARIYLEKMGITNNCVLRENSGELAKRFWGDFCYNEEENTFQLDSEDAGENRTFIRFILEPLYKLLVYSISEEDVGLTEFLKTVGIYLTKSELKLNVSQRLEVVCRKFFGDFGSLADFISQNIPSPRESSSSHIERVYKGPLNDRLSASMINLEKSDCPLVVFIAKQFHSENMETFYSFGKVYCGTLHKGDKVKVLGDSFSKEDPEDFSLKIVEKLWVFQSRYKIQVNSVPAGNWVLISGISSSVSKCCTLVGTEPNLRQDEIFPLCKVDLLNKSVIKVALEPHNPGDLPKMLEGLKSISKAYTSSRTKVEENGEHVLFGTGELQLDCMMHDLRCLYGNLDVKISDPMVRFCETVSEKSVVKCFGDSTNGQNRLYITAEPLEKGISEDLEGGLMKVSTRDLKGDPKHYSKLLAEKYGWDKLSVNSLWAFGPDSEIGSNVLLDDSSSLTVDKKLLFEVKNDIIHGFNWATKEGPLLEEPIRNVKFKILDVNLASDKINRGTGQIVPACRRACYTSMFLASPKILEPVSLVEVISPSGLEDFIGEIISKRRGHAGKEIPIPASPLVSILAFVPTIETFGLETDIRIHTTGQAFCTSCFDHWAIVPGNPLDRNISIKVLEKAPIPHLARDFLLKTRRRKGISDDVNIQNFITSPELLMALNY